MSSTESFDELEKKIAERIEEALSEIREDFLERLQGATGRLEEMLGSEMGAARQEAALAVTAEAEADEVRATLMAEAEEEKARAIAEAIDAKQAEFQEILGAKDATLAELEEARDAAVSEARDSAVAEAEEAKAAAIAEALEARESEFSEQLAAKDTTIAGLEEANESALAELRDEMEAALSAARTAAEKTLAGAPAAALQGIHETVANIDAARTQSEVLEALLAGSGRHSSRSILLLTQEDGLQGWGGQGFEAEEGRLQEIHLDYTDGSTWQELAEGRGTVELSNEACSELCRRIDGSEPQEGVLIPMILRDRLAAALYADRLDDDTPFLLAVLQLLTYVAGQALETLPMRQRSATATLRLISEAPVDEPGLGLWQFLVPDEAVEEEYAPEAVEEPVPEPAEPVEEELAEEETREEPSAVPESTDYVAAEETGFAVEEVVTEEPVQEPPSATEVEAPVEAPVPPQVAPPTEVAPPPSAAGAEVAPPEDVDGPGWAFTTRRFSEGSDEDAGHEEARRLARLLVTEIKLYNEEQVEEGRRGRNVYRTLRDDIDRSRQIYDERVAEGVRSDTDYFRDELVRILAGGDDEVMGM